MQGRNVVHRPPNEREENETHAHAGFKGPSRSEDERTFVPASNTKSMQEKDNTAARSAPESLPQQESTACTSRGMQYEEPCMRTTTFLPWHEIPRKTVNLALTIDRLDKRTSCSSGHLATSP